MRGHIVFLAVFSMIIAESSRIPEFSYFTLGCFTDHDPGRAVPVLLEGQDPILDGGYKSRQNAVQKCYQAALKRAYTVFALKDGGQCFSGATAEKTYDAYGPSPLRCPSDGKGGRMSKQVYRIKECTKEVPLSRLGCYKEKDPDRAVPVLLEGQDPILDGSYKSRQDAVQKCSQAALKRGYKVFAVQDGGQCFSGPTAQDTYSKYGRGDCLNTGQDGGLANTVYQIKEHFSTPGCFGIIKNSGRPVPVLLEGQDPILDGSYKSRQNAIEKCYLAALKRCYTLFAVQDGGQCFSGDTARDTLLRKYGRDFGCPRDGRGSVRGQQVYRIAGI